MSQLLLLVLTVQSTSADLCWEAVAAAAVKYWRHGHGVTSMTSMVSHSVLSPKQTYTYNHHNK